MATAKDMIRSTIGMADMVLTTYLEDLTDDDLLLAPVEGMNPIAWQLGHLIAGEREWVDKVKLGACPPLAEGFEAAHGKETASPNPFKPFASKADYLKAWKAQNAATLAVLDALPDDQLDAATGIDFAPTNAVLFNVIGGHALGHIGQFVAVRRKLGKKVVF